MEHRKYDFSRRNPPRDKFPPFLDGLGIDDPAITPHSVAEMRFELAPSITDAMVEAAKTGAFGYSRRPEEYDRLVCAWLRGRHGWDADPAWNCNSYGIVSALGVAVRAFSEPGDGVLIQPPVYPPFAGTVRQNGRKLVENPLVLRDGRWYMDFDDLREKAKAAKLLLFCSPQNPTGRVWTREELRELGEIALENDLIVVSDEIHFDFVFPGHRHSIFAEACPDAAKLSIICTSPGKSFNIPGLAVSNIMIPDEEVRARFSAQLKIEVPSWLNAMGVAATIGAYGGGAQWMDDAVSYIYENSLAFDSFFAERIPAAKLTEPDGTFLRWLDLGCLGMGASELMDFLAGEARLAVSNGTDFGAPEGYIRFNIGCPREDMTASLERLYEACRKNGII